MRGNPVGYRLAVLAIVLSGCAKKEAAVVEVKGPCADLNKSAVCTWAKMQGATVLEAGATVPIASIANAPAEAPMAWPPVADAAADIPDSARSGTGFQLLSVNWEPHGHPPGAFLTPHFDFHFYLIPAVEIAAIDCKDLTKPATLPAAYGLIDIGLPPDMAKMIGTDSLIGLCVPKMGMHSLLLSELSSTAPFGGDIVIGYYKTKPIFIEPMISKAKLMEKKSFDFPIPTVPGLAGVYPRKFHADWDEQGQSYRFVFSGFAPGA